MLKRLVSIFVALTVMVGAAQAQEQVWVQIEAQPNLNTAQDRIRDYSVALDDVNGFAMAGGWYAIALGPYSRVDGEQVMQVLRSEGKIPRDSYIAFASAYQRQFWPVGVNGLTATVAPSTTVTPSVTPDPEVAVVAPVEVVEPDETPAQARRSESALTRDERKELQSMLQWAGFYTSAIDGAFGRGTRRSMSDWQAANGFETTGVLTTLQRAALKTQFNAVLEGLDIQLIQDFDAGIEINIPTGVVGFDSYEAPFAQYNATGNLDAQVLLISQAGDHKTLFGLYDILQTLEIVPLDGPRERGKDNFVLVGENAQMVSHTQAWLKDGEIKGFTLIWPAGDEERRARLLGLMQESFVRLDGVLSPAAGNNENQRIDLISGLEIRKPKINRSGFYVDRNGTVVTTTDVLQSCTRVTLEGDITAEILGQDPTYGIAVLRPAEALAPSAIADLQLATPRLQSDVAVAGYSYGGVLGAPTLTFGALADMTGLSGEEELSRLAMASLPGDVGGPVFDAGGAVMGMLLPREAGARKLPDDVQFALDAAPIGRFLQETGVTPTATETLAQMAPEDLTELAETLTVLVSCWE